MSRTIEMIKAVRKAKKLLAKLCPKCQARLLTSQRIMDARRPEEMADSNDAIMSCLCEECEAIYSEAKQK